jgi:hypothetical protein
MWAKCITVEPTAPIRSRPPGRPTMSTPLSPSQLLRACRCRCHRLSEQARLVEPDRGRADVLDDRQPGHRRRGRQAVPQGQRGRLDAVGAARKLPKRSRPRSDAMMAWCQLAPRHPRTVLRCAGPFPPKTQREKHVDWLDEFPQMDDDRFEGHQEDHRRGPFRGFTRSLWRGDRRRCSRPSSSF